MLSRTILLPRLVRVFQTLKNAATGRNVYEELASRDMPAPLGALASSDLQTRAKVPDLAKTARVSAGRGPDGPLLPSEFGCASLWYLTCRRALASLDKAILNGDAAKVELDLAKLSSLMHLASALVMCGIWKGIGRRILMRSAEASFLDSLGKAVSKGLAKPGEVRGVNGNMFVRLDPTIKALADEESTKAALFSRALRAIQQGSGTTKINLEAQDLSGIPEVLRKAWASRLGSYAVWRNSEFSLYPNKDTLERVMPYLQRRETRQQIFRAFYENADKSKCHEAALELLQIRQKRARQMGYASWSEYSLRNLSVNNMDDAWQLLDSAWADIRQSLAPVNRKMMEVAITQGRLQKPQGKSSGKARSELEGMEQIDEAFYRSIATRRIDMFKLAEYLPSTTALEGLLSVASQAYGVRLSEIKLDPVSSGMDSNITVVEVRDDSPAARRLGYIYVMHGSPDGSLLPGAMLMTAGHVALNLNQQKASIGSTKLLTFEEATNIAHELGHAVHMLCQCCPSVDFHDQPLDLLELPSTLLEIIATHPSVMPRFAKHHASEGPPSEELVRICRVGTTEALQGFLQACAVSLGLHGPNFDAESATPAHLREEALKLWQRYSFVVPDKSYTPLADAAGLHVLNGPDQLAYLICFLRSDMILNGAQIQGKNKEKDLGKIWLRKDFADKVRGQLLERPVQGQRQAAIMPSHHGDSEAKSSVQIPHPLPPLQQPRVPAGMYSRRLCL